ncbi:MAG: carboxypeptidase-like regulatory domain-containing protein [Ignavibacteria bacterium]
MKNLLLFLFLVITLSPLAESENLYCKNSNEVSAFISGRVVDEKRFPVPKVKVTIGNAEVTTDNSGKFTIPNINLPYDVTIAEKTSATAVIYRNLSINNPELVLFGDLENRFSNYVALNISFPKIPEGGSAVIKLISTETFECKEATPLAGDSTAKIHVVWPVSENYINGQVIYLLRDDKGFQYLKFTKVSIHKNDVDKKVTVSKKKGNALSTSFVNVYQPAEKNLKTEFDLSLFFFNYNLNSGIKFSENSSGNEKTQVWVPDKVSVTNKILVRGSGLYSNGSGYTGLNYVSPGADLKLYPESPPELFTPSDNYLGASGNTNFTYSLGSGTGIYVIEFRSVNPLLNIYVVTSDRKTNLSYLSRNEFYNGSYQFTWRVRKYITFFNESEFVKPNVFKNDFSYKAVSYSAKRKFKTGYN